MAQGLAAQARKAKEAARIRALERDRDSKAEHKAKKAGRKEGQRLLEEDEFKKKQHGKLGSAIKKAQEKKSEEQEAEDALREKMNKGKKKNRDY